MKEGESYWLRRHWKYTMLAMSTSDCCIEAVLAVVAVLLLAVACKLARILRRHTWCRFAMAGLLWQAHVKAV